MQIGIIKNLPHKVRIVDNCIVECVIHMAQDTVQLAFS